MTTTTAHEPLVPTDDDQDARERLRSLIPVAISVVLLLGVTVVAGLVLEDVVELGAWFVSDR